MSDNYGLGPQGPQATQTRPADSTGAGWNVQTWFKDTSAPGEEDGTIVSATFLNRILGQFVYLGQITNVSLGSNQSKDSFLFECVRRIGNGLYVPVTAFNGKKLADLIDSHLGQGWRTGPGTLNFVTPAQLTAAISSVTQQVSTLSNSLGTLAAKNLTDALQWTGAHLFNGNVTIDRSNGTTQLDLNARSGGSASLRWLKRNVKQWEAQSTDADNALVLYDKDGNPVLRIEQGGIVQFANPSGLVRIKDGSGNDPWIAFADDAGVDVGYAGYDGERLALGSIDGRPVGLSHNGNQALFVYGQYTITDRPFRLHRYASLAAFPPASNAMRGAMAYDIQAGISRTCDGINWN